ncbi:hypothetical protein [Acinetobacter baumannii]|uniref:hypothetical protein n=1 Tax=Acinetobacter baumannii TaxID=470 RepID=UPI0036F49F5A
MIKDQDGTELVKRPLTAEDLENGITVKVTPAAEGEDTVVTAVVTDPQAIHHQKVKTTQQLTWLFRVMWMVMKKT